MQSLLPFISFGLSHFGVLLLGPNDTLRIFLQTIYQSRMEDPFPLCLVLSRAMMDACTPP